MPLDFEAFNVQEYLSDRDIPYSTEGENVTAGWINLQCVFCNDDKNHLGISPSNGVHCWRCGSHGLIELIQTIDDCNKSEAYRVIAKYQDPNREVSLGKVYSNILEYPKDDIDYDYYPEMLSYLEGRGFSEETIKQYQLEPIGRFGKYKFRILIPIFENGRMVTFTTRSYMNAEISKLHYDQVPIKNYLYNSDTVIDKLGIVEGPTDVWALGQGFVATFGIEYSREQVLKIVRMKPKRIFIIFDSEDKALEQADKLRFDLLLYYSNVEVIELPTGKDPAELSTDEREEIRRL